MQSPFYQIKSAKFSSVAKSGNAMTKSSSRGYPPQHPYYGRPLIQVTDHDVLSGRGVNISQHPGNERFRALVNTRQDASYCSGFTTSEKRALAEEIVAHIRNLDPPGRFLKRVGRSQSSRGLSGPWEELSHRECIKKACQALRDCNRQDRQGYAAAVRAPTDVAVNAEERARTGLSLKEYAAAAAAAAALENPNALGYSYQAHPTSETSVTSNNPVAFEFNDASTTEHSNTAGGGDRMSPTVDLAAPWLRRPQVEENQLSSTAGMEYSHVVEPVMSNFASPVHATPAPFVAPVPVSTTPPSAQSHSDHSNGHMAHHAYLHTDHLVVSHHADSPTLYQRHETMAAAPYSPVVLLNVHDDEDDDDHNLDPHAHLETYSTTDHLAQQFDDHHPFHSSHHDDDQHEDEDVLQTAAAAAASSMGNHLHHHRDNSLSLINGDDDGTNESLHISDL